jgi:hypothetical protein
VTPPHGPWDPATTTPLLAAGAVRRTTRIDSTRDGGDLRVALHGADTDRPPVVLTMVVDDANREIRAAPDVPELVGLVVGPGFRRRVAELLPDDLATRSLRHLLLDDLPGALLVSGYALMRAGATPPSARGAAGIREHMADLCAGWVGDGSMLQHVDETGQVPTPVGPPAPVLDDTPALPVGGMRRRRRIDVDGEEVDVHFRDSWFGPDGEVVLHEYSLRARVVDGVLVDVAGHANVLPWTECPGAIGHIGAVAGARLEDLADRVRADLVGPISCTHLNDTVRSLADAAALVGRVRSASGGPGPAGR